MRESESESVCVWSERASERERAVSQHQLLFCSVLLSVCPWLYLSLPLFLMPAIFMVTASPAAPRALSLSCPFSRSLSPAKSLTTFPTLHFVHPDFQHTPPVSPTFFPAFRHYPAFSPSMQTSNARLNFNPAPSSSIPSHTRTLHADAVCHEPAGTRGGLLGLLVGVAGAGVGSGLLSPVVRMTVQVHGRAWAHVSCLSVCLSVSAACTCLC